MVNTLLSNNNNNNKRMSIRKALAYSGCSKNMYYYNSIKQKKYHGNHITTAATAAVTASSSSTTSTTTTMIEQEIQQISMERPSYGTRRMAAMLTRILGIPVNRKRVQRENIQKDGLHYTIQKETRNHAFKSTQCKNRQTKPGMGSRSNLHTLWY